MTLTVGSLFTGIGGLDLGLERAGMRVAWQAEIDPYCCQVLAKHWPGIPNLGNVTTINWEDVPRVDLITGGYPCQPFSVAGARAGENDPRHLWPHVRNALRVLRPRWALLENVAGHLSLGFGRVLGDLAEIGYDAEWDCIPAAAVGAPHRRDRVFLVAYPNRQGVPTRPEHGTTPGNLATDPNSEPIRQQQVSELRSSAQAELGHDGNEWHVADTACVGRWPRFRPSDTTRIGWHESPHRCSSSRGHWASEPDVGRVAYGLPNRVDRLRALGNAVVPQVAEHVGRLIMEAAQCTAR